MPSVHPSVTSITGPDGGPGPVDVRCCLNAILPRVTVNITNLTPALVVAAQRALLAEQQRHPIYDLRCEHGHGDLSSHMKAGDACRWDEGQCGGVLKKVAS